MVVGLGSRECVFELGIKSVEVLHVSASHGSIT